MPFPQATSSSGASPHQRCTAAESRSSGSTCSTGAVLLHPLPNSPVASAKGLSPAAHQCRGLTSDPQFSRRQKHLPGAGSSPMLTSKPKPCCRAAPSAWLPDSIVAGDSPEAHAADLAVELVCPFCSGNHIGAGLRFAHVYISGLTIGCVADVPELFKVKDSCFGCCPVSCRTN